MRASEYPIWILETLYDNIGVLQAKEDLRLAEIVLKFSRQADKKNKRSLKGVWRRFINQRKKRISQGYTSRPKPKQVKRFDFESATEEEKEAYNRWLDEQGIRRE